MPAYKIERPGRPLQKLVVDISSYAAGWVLIEFAPNIGLNPNHIAEHLRGYQIQSDIRISNNALLIVDFANYRQVFNYILARDWFTDQERPEMGQIAQCCDTQLQRRNNLIHGSQLGHKQALSCLTDVYIEDILEVANDPHFATTLLCCSFTYNFPAIKADLQQCILKNNCRADVIDSVEALWRINSGEANLEDHYSRISEKLPSLTTQRIINNKNITGKFLEKFSSVGDEVQFICILSLLMFKVINKSLSPLADLRKIIKDALNEPIISMVSRAAFANSDGNEIMMPLVTQAFAVIGILRMEGAPDMQRLAALQAILRSPHIEKYIREITLNAELRSQEINDPLYRGLKAKNASAVAAAIKQGAPLDRYFTCGRTPLLLAIQNNDGPSVKLLLSAGANVNQINKFGLYNAIGAAINCNSPDILRDILSHPDAQLFHPCDSMAVMSKTYPPIAQPVSAPVFLIGAQKFLEDPNNAHKRAMMRCLLEAGLGLGYQFEPEFTPLLNGVVIIGSTWHQQPNISPITTISEFQQRISPGNFEYWKSLFQQVFFQTYLSGNSNLLMQLSTLNSWLRERRVTMAHDSPIFNMGLRYRRALARIEAIIQVSGDEDFNSIIQSLQKHNYGIALRQACSTDDPNGFVIARIILEQKEVFPLDINEKGTIKPLAAIHYAAKRGDLTLYNLLCEHKANPDLTNADGVSAAEMLRHATSALTPV